MKLAPVQILNKRLPKTAVRLVAATLSMLLIVVPALLLLFERAAERLRARWRVPVPAGEGV